MNNGVKNVLEDTLEGMVTKVDNNLNQHPAGLNGYELEEMKEELELCLELVKNE